MNRSTSVRVCASPSALCCKTKYIPGESDWSESTKLDGWDQWRVSLDVCACMYVWIPDQVQAFEKVRERQAKKNVGSSMISSYFLSAVLARGERAGREMRPGSTLKPTRETQHRVNPHALSANQCVVRVNRITCNLISVFQNKALLWKFFFQQLVEYFKRKAWTEQNWFRWDLGVTL